jgi:hypothetical protein
VGIIPSHLGLVNFELGGQMSSHKRKRAASELLHGGFEPYKGDDSDNKNAFAYQLESRDYTEPSTQSRKAPGGGYEDLINIPFVRLEDIPHIYDRLPRRK